MFLALYVCRYFAIVINENWLPLCLKERRGTLVTKPLKGRKGCLLLTVSFKRGEWEKKWANLTSFLPDGFLLVLSSAEPNGMPESKGTYWSDPGKFTSGGAEVCTKCYNEETQTKFFQLTFRVLWNTV